MLALLDHQPDIYLDEIAEQLMEQLDISVLLSTIHMTLKLLGVTTKKVSQIFYSVQLLPTLLQLLRVAAEHCEDVRQLFLYNIAQEPAWRLVFVDESSVNLLTTYRTTGRAFKGKHARMRSYFQHGDR
jgi:hypothetical protein